jgi:hypothetical protein
MNSPLPKEPLFFLKPTTSYLQKKGCIILPRGSEVDHEGTLYPFSSFTLLVELGVVMGKRGRGIRTHEVEAYISGTFPPLFFLFRVRGCVGYDRTNVSSPFLESLHSFLAKGKVWGRAVDSFERV